MANIGVITEQGYVAGKFGFDVPKDKDMQAKLESAMKDKKEKDEEEKKKKSK